MPTLRIETIIAAPPARCFDLAYDIDLHTRTAGATRERAIAGRTRGLIGLGESVTFEGVHFGVRQRFTARVTQFDPPRRFVDEMTRGAFRTMTHIHEFAPIAHGGTRMRDTLIWTAPFGVLGVLADKVLLVRHMERFVRERNAVLKTIAESASHR